VVHACFPDPPMLALVTRTFDVAVVALIFVAFS
jgi:hypothetical protein